MQGSQRNRQLSPRPVRSPEPARETWPTTRFQRAVLQPDCQELSLGRPSLGAGRGRGWRGSAETEKLTCCVWSPRLSSYLAKRFFLSSTPAGQVWGKQRTFPRLEGGSLGASASSNHRETRRQLRQALRGFCGEAAATRAGRQAQARGPGLVGRGRRAA